MKLTPAEARALLAFRASVGAGGLLTKEDLARLDARARAGEGVPAATPNAERHGIIDRMTGGDYENDD